MKITLIQLDGSTVRPTSLPVDGTYIVASVDEPPIPFVKITRTGKNAITVEMLAPPLALDDAALKWAARKHFLGEQQ